MNYRIPLPGGRIDGGVLHADVRNPGMAIEVSTDGLRWTAYRAPVRVGDWALLRTHAVDGRASRLSPVGVPRWTAGTAYAAGAVIVDQGDVFRADKDVAAGAAAPTDATNDGWTAL